MSDTDSKGTPGDLADRVRVLDEALRLERQERSRLQRACEESRRLVHRLNNALSIITAFTAVMRDEIGARDPLRESLDEITRAAKQAAAVTRELQELRG